MKERVMKEICMKYLEAKSAEQAAKDARLAAEAELISAFGPTKDEGTETKATDGFKVAITTKLNRVLDIDAYQALELPENMAFVDFKPAINLKNLRMIERIDPSLAAQCITTKPAKPSIKVEEVA
jgi:hypothetical protein